MMQLTKRMKRIRLYIDKTKQYHIQDAITLLKKSSSVQFIESVDVAINLNIDIHKSEQFVRDSIILPHGTGRDVRLAVFAQGIDAIEAKNAGVSFVGMQDLVDIIKTNKIAFDRILAAPYAMNIVSPLSQILGPKNLMPNPKFGTVTSNIVKAIQNIRKGQIFYRNDKNGIIHTIIGKINFESYQLQENLETLLATLKKKKKKINQRKLKVYILKISIYLLLWE